MKANGAPKYDLEERTEAFAADVRRLVRGLAMTAAHHEEVGIA